MAQCVLHQHPVGAGGLLIICVGRACSGWRLCVYEPCEQKQEPEFQVVRELPCGYCELNPGPLPEQSALLTTAVSPALRTSFSLGRHRLIPEAYGRDSEVEIVKSTAFGTGALGCGNTRKPLHLNFPQRTGNIPKYPFFSFSALCETREQILANHCSDRRHLRRSAPRVHLPTHGGLRVSIF